MSKLVTFKSLDGLLITADYYPVDNSKDLILLCHRSHFNRGEYKDIAPRLNELGYSCLAIDQRSGMNVLGYTNETSTRAKAQKLPTGYLAAKPDIEAAIGYAVELNEGKSIILMGSSYSASLCLILAPENPKIKAVITFSPGEYLKQTDVAALITNLTIPIYVTSSQAEITATTKLVSNVNPQLVTQFKPDIAGAHGARVLWPHIAGNEVYWSSLINFLSK